MLDHLPDVADQNGQLHYIAIQHVGMDGIAVPVNIQAGSEVIPALTRASAYVDLVKKEARGIHMSRLFRVLTDRLDQEIITPQLLRETLAEMLESHDELSTEATLVLSGSLALSRQSLLSKLSGFRAYPFVVTAKQKHQHVTIKLEIEILYSSTCPASAALSRQMIAQAFARNFAAGAAISPDQVVAWLQSDQGLPATPHAQRSAAHVAIQLLPHAKSLPFVELIDQLEHAVATPVQTSVKRIDEQEFARLNATHLKFAEDAVRVIYHALRNCDFAEDFAVKVSHWESLHAHNAVAFTSLKPGGGLGHGDLNFGAIRSHAEGS